MAELLTGWSEAEGDGRPLAEVFSIVRAATREPIDGLAERVLQEGAIVVFPEPSLLLARDGTERPLDDSAAPIRGENGETIGVVLIFRDVTARAVAEAERARFLARESAALRGAEAALLAKDNYLDTMAHDLRTPLNAILGWSKMLRTRNLDGPKAAGALEAIEHNAQAQVQLVNDLLDTSRMVVGKLRLELHAVDLSRIIEDAGDALRPAADEKGLSLDLDLQPAARPVAGNTSRLRQVFWNLLSNAIRFTPGGGRVRIALRYTRSEALISIADTGQGIRADFKPHLFEWFSQDECTTRLEPQGLGLGLAIVSEIVKLHGGTVWVESPGAGQGATFKLTLPLAADIHRGESGVGDVPTRSDVECAGP